MTTTMRWFIIVVLGFAFLAATARACAVPAGGVPDRDRVYLPLAAQGAPRCNRWRGDDWWPCIEATLTAEARISSTPTATFRPWSSSTPTPVPLRCARGETWCLRAQTATAEAITSSTPTASREPWDTPTPGLLAMTGGRASIRIDGRSGYCAPMADGCYTAAHVLRGARSVAIAGVPARWSVDVGGRDLAHVVAAEDPAVTLRAAVIGEGLAWSNTRASGRWRVAATAGGAITVCGAQGYVLFGDSGTGGYAESDGALIGVLTNADLGQGWQASLACESGQEARLEGVP